MTATKHVEAGRWLAWTSVLTRRFAVRSRLRRGLPLELLRHRTSVVIRRISRHPTIAVNVSLSHATRWVVTDRQEQDAMTSGSPWQARLGTDAPMRMSPSPWGLQQATVVSGRAWPDERGRLRTRAAGDQQVGHALVSRVLARTDRVETRATSRDLVLAAPPAAATPRRAPVEAELLQASMASQARMSSGSWGGREPSSPPLNVDRLADQVLQQLDRRVSAWRERMGRT